MSVGSTGEVRGQALRPPPFSSAAQVGRDFVDDILEGDPDALVMVAGDLSDFQFGEPGEGSDHPVAIL